jgi:hypothetical protein
VCAAICCLKWERLIHWTSAGNLAAASGGLELANADAERAVVRVKQKLQGLEGGEWCYSASGSNEHPNGHLIRFQPNSMIQNLRFC